MGDRKPTRCSHGIRWPHECDDCLAELPDECPDCGKPWHEHQPEDNCGAQQKGLQE